MAMRVKVVLFMLVVVFVLPAGVESTAAKKSVQISVSAGSFDRRECVGSFELPDEFKDATYALRDESGRVVPLQVNSQRQATFVLATLKAGKTKNYPSNFLEVESPASLWSRTG